MDDLKRLDITSIPCATAISVCVCQDPTCGPHIVFWSDEEMLAHAPLSIDHARGVIKDLQEIIEWRIGLKQ